MQSELVEKETILYKNIIIEREINLDFDSIDFNFYKQLRQTMKLNFSRYINFVLVLEYVINLKK